MKRLVVLAAAAALWGCADAPLQPTIATPAPARHTGITDPCVTEEDPMGTECTGTGDSIPTTGGFWPLFGEPGDLPYQASGDPFPSSPGIYLGWVKPGACFSDVNRDAIAYDADLDWLDDRCELEIAKAFAPSLKFSADDNCPKGEPYWAAKYFPSRGMVRIAYLPAYYKDCGAFGHSGDSEFISVEVIYDAATQHWLFNRMFLSAHYGTPTDASSWRNWSEAQYTWKPRAHPTVWVAIDKHANYYSKPDCDAWFDGCNWTASLPLRFPVDPNHNVGSRHVHFKDAVLSEKKPAGVDPYRAEWMWASGANFRGWQSNFYGIEAARPYGDWLSQQQFEVYWDGTLSSTGDSGPGPEAPPRTPTGPTY
jgi:hypothetical protein